MLSKSRHPLRLLSRGVKQVLNIPLRGSQSLSACSSCACTTLPLGARTASSAQGKCGLASPLTYEHYSCSMREALTSIQGTHRCDGTRHIHTYNDNRLKRGCRHGCAPSGKRVTGGVGQTQIAFMKAGKKSPKEGDKGDAPATTGDIKGRWKRERGEDQPIPPARSPVVDIPAHIAKLLLDGEGVGGC